MTIPARLCHARVLDCWLLAGCMEPLTHWKTHSKGPDVCRPLHALENVTSVTLYCSITWRPWARGAGVTSHAQQEGSSAQRACLQQAGSDARESPRNVTGHGSGVLAQLGARSQLVYCSVPRAGRTLLACTDVINEVSK